MRRNPHTCQICTGPLAHLGTLGTRAHFRCIDCGMDQSRPERRRGTKPAPVYTRRDDEHDHELRRIV